MVKKKIILYFLKLFVPGAWVIELERHNELAYSIFVLCESGNYKVKYNTHL